MASDIEKGAAGAGIARLPQLADLPFAYYLRDAASTF
jgi:hypothetical protein